MARDEIEHLLLVLHIHPDAQFVEQAMHRRAILLREHLSPRSMRRRDTRYALHPRF